MAARGTRGLTMVLMLAVLTGLGACDRLPGLSGSCRGPNAQVMRVSELFFGRSMPDGGYVGDIDWEQFLEQQVTPRFPRGFTVLDAYGQYQMSNGLIARENSKMMIVAADDTADTTAKLDAIIAAYKSRFRQQAVIALERRECVAIK
ncbi:MAG TPA: DUF3574 domain-containing protein [Alphaproteobacteria bacterium]|nr:DUF3574 domain-containing protein [Alphaproteobacteria bacterium]